MAGAGMMAWLMVARSAHLTVAVIVSTSPSSLWLFCRFLG
jgi:hypothetical protein